MPFLNRNRIFTVYERSKLNNGTFLYWVEEEDGKKINGRFLRQELFALNNEFLKWQHLFLYILEKHLDENNKFTF